MGNFFQDRRQSRQEEHTTGGTRSRRPPEGSQPVPPGDPLDDSPALGNMVRDIVLTEGDAQLETFTEPQ